MIPLRIQEPESHPDQKGIRKPLNVYRNAGAPDQRNQKPMHETEEIFRLCAAAKCEMRVSVPETIVRE